MRIDKLLRKIARRRRFRFGTVYARIIESQPFPAAICTGTESARNGSPGKQ